MLDTVPLGDPVFAALGRLAAASGDGLALIDGAGRILHLSATACTLLGLAEEGLCRGAFALLFPAHERPEIEACLAAGMAASSRWSSVLRSASGAERALECTVVPHGVAGQVGGIVTLHDVTAYRHTAMRAAALAEEQLQEKEAQYRAIFEATTDGLLITDMEGYLVEVNPAACRLNGYSREELLGRHVRDLVHPDFLPQVAEGLRAVAEHGTFEARSVGVRKDGSAFFSEATATLFTYKGTSHILGRVRDTTERVQAYELLEQRVAERTRALSALLDISHNVASTLDLRPLLGLILAQLKTVVEYTGAAIWQLSADGQELINLDYQGPLPREEILQLRFPVGHTGPDFAVVHSRRPVIVDDIGGKSRLAWAWEEATGRSPDHAFEYVRSWMGVPLVLKERVIGILVVVYQEPNHYTARHADLALAVANQAAIAIENAQLYERAQEAAVLEERQRLARELHDSVSQALYGIALGAQTARRLLDMDPARLREPLDYVLELAEAALAEMRALIFELLPRALETEGLVAALSKQAAAVQARHGIAVSTSFDAEPAAPPAAKEALYRIAQEALHNTVKHARAQRVQLLLEGSAAGLILEIHDDGVGFDPGGAFPGHLGLQTMRDRAARAGGALAIASAPGTGTRIRVQIPAPGQAAGLSGR